MERIALHLGCCSSPRSASGYERTLFVSARDFSGMIAIMNITTFSFEMSNFASYVLNYQQCSLFISNSEENLNPWSLSRQNFIHQNNFLNDIISVILVLGPVGIMYYISEIVSHNSSYSLKDKNQNNSRNVMFKNIAQLRNEEFWIRIFIHAKINLCFLFLFVFFFCPAERKNHCKFQKQLFADVLQNRFS